MRFSYRPFALALALMMLTTGMTLMSSQTQASVGADDSGLKEQAPFIIEGDGDMAAKAMAFGWPGDGTSARPYRIEGMIIQCDANTSPISIRNTTLCFQISNCWMIATGQDGVSYIYRSAGVSLTNVANGALSRLSINGFFFGVDVASSRDVKIENCSVSAPREYGIIAQQSQRMVIENNTFQGPGGTGIRMISSEWSTIQYNNASFTGYCGMDLRDDNHGFLIRWNVVSSNGRGGTSAVSNGINVGGTGHQIYGNVFVGANRFSPPAGTAYASGNMWYSPDGYGNYYGINYISATMGYSSFLGEPTPPLADYDHDGISNVNYTIRSYGGDNEELGVDEYPLFSPTSPPRDLKATVSNGLVTLTWERPLFTTSPAGHYVVTRHGNGSTEEMIADGRSLTDSIEHLGDWDSISYTVRWVGKYLSSGPSNSVGVQNPDRPSLEITSRLDGSQVTLLNLTRMSYTSLDPRSVTVMWAGYDSDSDSMSYMIRLDNGEWLDNGNSQQRTLTNLTEGAHTVTIKATDNNGNQVEASKTFEVYRYVEITLACRPYEEENMTKLRLDGRAWDAATGVGMVDLPIGVAYSVDRGTSWDFGSATTGSDGRFEFAIGLETEVIHGLMFTATIRDLNNEVHYFIEEGSYAAVVPQGQSHLFMAYSERTISDLSFSSRMMRFNVSAGNDELGITTILIPKAASEEGDDITIALDGARYDHEVSEDGDYWVLSINHNSSSHYVTVEIGPSGLGLVSSGDLPLIAAGAAGIAIMVGITVLAWRSKRSGGRP